MCDLQSSGLVPILIYLAQRRLESAFSSFSLRNAVLDFHDLFRVGLWCSRVQHAFLTTFLPNTAQIIHFVLKFNNNDLFK